MVARVGKVSCRLLRRAQVEIEAKVSASRGTAKLNVLPCWTLLSTQIRPPINSTRLLEMVRPSPEPPKRLVVELSASVNRLNTLGNVSPGIPITVSCTEKRRDVGHSG